MGIGSPREDAGGCALSCALKRCLVRCREDEAISEPMRPQRRIGSLMACGLI